VPHNGGESNGSNSSRGDNNDNAPAAHVIERRFKICGQFAERSQMQRGKTRVGERMTRRNKKNWGKEQGDRSPRTSKEDENEDIKPYGGGGGAGRSGGERLAGRSMGRDKEDEEITDEKADEGRFSITWEISGKADDGRESKVHQKEPKVILGNQPCKALPESVTRGFDRKGSRENYDS